MPDEREGERLARTIDEASPDIARAAANRVFEEVPSYGASPAKDELRGDITAHCMHVFRLFTSSLAENRKPQQDEFGFTVDQAMRRVTQAISLPDFLRAFRVAQITLWESIRDLLEHDVSLRLAAFDAMGHMMDVIEIGTTAAAEAYLEAERFLIADAARATRDLVEDLLAGNQPKTGPRRAALKTAGLSASGGFAILVGRVVNFTGERNTLVRVMGRAAANYPGGLLTMRRNEIIGVLPLQLSRGTKDVLSQLSIVIEELRSHCVELSLGLSTAQSGLGAAPQGYEEAKLALRYLRGRPGMQALEHLTAFDYLISRGDEVAWGLIPERVRRFIDEDLAGDRVYIDTLNAYVAADLNAKAAAEALFVHSNTAYHRLDRISERTGLDLRGFRTVLDLLVAIKLRIAQS
ncbi:helix-turn-helix domain-containing protein [Hoyosella sp. YIM 151337]|uniref:PucR family transcriptional regulator n=1 Tax=Hoyosella sp. YIM 151337 TaxID=2992742 RepID=UPI0022354E1B|nr:helix-turn-helix domain-containing protein [Hoyosella sp. YIM 151337]MCW4354538.1 helix-turn-helix domain-containing protein [Hoyosella sp. YIM 151337]